MSGQLNRYNDVAEAQARPEGAMTQRLRTVAEELDGLTIRLNRMLITARGAPPPSPVEGNAGLPRSRDLLDRVTQIEHCLKQAYELAGELETVL